MRKEPLDRTTRGSRTTTATTQRRYEKQLDFCSDAGTTCARSTLSSSRSATSISLERWSKNGRTSMGAKKSARLSQAVSAPSPAPREFPMDSQHKVGV